MYKSIYKKQSINYGIAYTFFSGLQKGLGFVVFMFLANVFTIKEFSKFGINYSIFTVISMLTYAGIQESVVSQLSTSKGGFQKDSLFKAANSVYLIFCSILIIGFLLFSFPLFYFFSLNFRELLFLVLGAIISSFFNYQSLIIRLEQKHFESIVLSFFPAVIAYASGLIFVRYFLSGESYFGGILLGYTISLILFLFFKKTFKGIYFNKIAIQNIISRIFPYIVIAFWGWLLGYGNAFVIKLLFDDYSVASFVFFYTISSILQLVASSMNQVWSPSFFLRYSSDSLEALEKKNILFTTAQGLILGIVGCLILVLFPLASKYFANLKNYNDVFGMFWIFAAYVVSIPWWHAQNYFMINDKGNSLMKLTVVSCIIGYIFWFLCMLIMGSIGIYIGFFIQMLVRSLIVYFQAKLQWGIKFDWQGISLGLFFLMLSCLFFI